MKPHILVTNDDGIDSHFLRELVLALVKDFRVTVVAPMGEQSWIGRAVSHKKIVHGVETEDYPCKAYALDGTPTDCVNIALSDIVKEDPPQAVCSGINIGYNVGIPMLLSSGTFAGAIEGAVWGVPAFAFSHLLASSAYEGLRKSHGLATGAFAETLKCSAAHASKLVKSHIDDPITGVTVHNINFPIETTMETEVERTEPIVFKSLELFKRESPVSFHFEFPSMDIEYRDEPTDFHCLKRSHISHTIIDLSKIGKLGE